MCNTAEITLDLPASIFVRTEAVAAEENRSLESAASFLLSKWVESIPQGRARQAEHSPSRGYGAASSSAIKSEGRRI